MNGVALLVAARLRRDRWLLVAWVVGIAGLWWASAAGIAASFTDADITGLVQLLASNPALLMVRGAPAGDSLNAAIMASLFSYLGVMTALMATFTAVRHTRGDEDAGRAELVRAAPIGRLAPLVSTWVAGAVEVLVIGLAVFGAAMLAAPELPGAWLLAVAIVGIGLAFLAIGTLCAQVLPTSRAANGAAAATVGVAFLLRAIGDGTGTVESTGMHVASGPAAWASPIGWGALAHPFATDPWSPDATPLLLYLPAIVVIGAVTLLIARRRELGASIVRERQGRAIGSAALGSPLGLTVRQQRGAAIGWAVGAGVAALALGRMVPTILTSAADNPMVQVIVQVLGHTDGSVDIADVFLFAFAGIVAIIASAAGMQSVLHVRTEESSRGETTFATRVERSTWLGVGVVLGIASGLLVLAVFYVVTGLSMSSAGQTDRWDDLARIVLSVAPSVIVWVAVAALLVAALPAVAGWLGWLLLLGLMLVGEFSQLFGPDWEWVKNLSPFTWLPNPLEAEPDVWPAVWMLLGAAVVIAGALVWFRRRDARLA